MKILSLLTIADFKAEKQILEEFVPGLNLWKGLAIWINTFAEEYNKRDFFEILKECYDEEILKGGKNV